MTKEKALYQVKLIIDNLSEEEYNLIPKDIIKYIEDNMEVDESITINPEIPLEEQDIDDKTYDILENMLNRIDPNILLNAENGDNTEIEIPPAVTQPVDIDNGSLENENRQLKELNEMLKQENSKIAQIKELVIGYKNELSKKNQEVENLKAQNEALYNSIKKCPKLIRKIYFKDFENKLLKPID